MKIKNALMIAAFGGFALFLPSCKGEKESENEKMEAGGDDSVEVLEGHAEDVMNSAMKMPDIVGSIKDEESLKKAEADMEDMIASLKKKAAELEKLPKPSNEVRLSLQKKMEEKEKEMDAKMAGIQESMMKLPPELMMKVGPLMQKFGAAMQELSPTMEAYFSPDKGE